MAKDDRTSSGFLYVILGICCLTTAAILIAGGTLVAGGLLISLDMLVAVGVVLVVIGLYMYYKDKKGE